MAITREQLAQLYIANYNRCPDASGFYYWIGVSSTGVTLTTITNSFLDIVENGVNLRAKSNAEYVVWLIEKLYARTALVTDSEVVDLAALITAGTYTTATMIQHMVSIATGNDAAAINNKTTVALASVDAGLDSTTNMLSSVTYVDSTAVEYMNTIITVVAETPAPVDTDCTTVLPTMSTIPTTLSVEEKFKALSKVALASDSIYMKAKDTFKELFDGKKINETDYANLAGQFISQLAVATTQQVMQGSLQWAQQEKELPYALAQIKANTETTIAQREKAKYEICNLKKQTELQCANITATLATSIRKNGRVSSYDPNNPCIPLSLHNEGSEYAQMQVLEAQKYSTLADTYRKSGVVTIGTTSDGVEKGTAGDTAGYTNAQDMFARRQILSFEDSKRSHAANAASQMIGQLLAQETIPATEYVTQWNRAMSYLLTNTLDVDNNGEPDIYADTDGDGIYDILE